MATKLERLGFHVKLLLNPSSREMKGALTGVIYGVGTQEDRALFIYFAGRGETLELADGTKLGYIIPSDCPLKMKDPIGFDDKAISNYPSNPDLNHILSIFFMFTSLKVEGGSPGSNVVWIDEITLE